MHVISARAAALCLISEETQELFFEVAFGQKAEEVKKFRVPLGRGIAGLVASTGQPMAVSDAQQDPRQAADIAEQVGYFPRTILCVPLLYSDETIGVLELLDKEGGASFTMADMEALSRFANTAAVAIEQSRAQRNLAALVDQALASLGGLPPDQERELRQGAQDFVRQLEEGAGFARALELARLVEQIAAQGESEAQACRGILLSFVEYLRSRQRSGGDVGRR
jgi:GAF domain-containing protein